MVEVLGVVNDGFDSAELVVCGGAAQHLSGGFLDWLRGRILRCGF